MPNVEQFNNNEERNAWYREYRKKNHKRLREYGRNYNNVWRKQHGYAAEKRAKKKFPEKEYARKLLGRAVKIGKINRGNCDVCGKPNGQGHHDDYFKPLEVRWFCPLHHRQHHPHPEDK